MEWALSNGQSVTIIRGDSPKIAPKKAREARRRDSTASPTALNCTAHRDQSKRREFGPSPPQSGDVMVLRNALKRAAAAVPWTAAAEARAIAAKSAVAAGTAASTASGPSSFARRLAPLATNAPGTAHAARSFASAADCASLLARESFSPSFPHLHPDPAQAVFARASASATRASWRYFPRHRPFRTHLRASCSLFPLLPPPPLARLLQTPPTRRSRCRRSPLR